MNALTVAKTANRAPAKKGKGGKTKGSKGRKKNPVATTSAAKSPVSIRENYARLRNRIAQGAAKVRDGVTQAIYTAETQGALGGSAFAAGYLGPAKLRFGSSPLTDYRLIGGGALLGWGLMEAFTGHGKSGAHALALGNGVLGSVVYETAHNAGVELAAKRGKVTKAPGMVDNKRQSTGIAGTRPVLVSGDYETGYDTGSAVGRSRLHARR